LVTAAGNSGTNQPDLSQDLLYRSIVLLGGTPEQAERIVRAARERIEQTPACSSQDYHSFLSEVLSRELGASMARLSLGIDEPVPLIGVTQGSRHSPFSKGLLSRSISAAGIDSTLGYSIARGIETDLRQRGLGEVTRRELRRMTHDRILELCGEEAAAQYLVWRSLGSLRRPLIILIGGATGAGKSTLAAELGYRLGVISVISTDVIREIMRSMLTDTLMPFIHKSSYEAWAKVTFAWPKHADAVILGFQEQVAQVKVGIDAIIRRCCAEKTDIVLNGVHVVPGLIDPACYQDAHAYILLTAVEDAEAHRERFKTRSEFVQDRASGKYLANFDNIRAIQDHILDLAAANDKPVLREENPEQQVARAIRLLTDFIRTRPDFQMVEL